MIFSTADKPRRGRSGWMVSAVLHAGLLALVIFALEAVRPPVVQYQSRRGTLTALYWNGTPSTGKTSLHAPVHPQKTRKPAPPKPAKAVLAPPAPAPPQTQAASGEGAAAQPPTPGTGSGSDDAEPALPVYYPAPGVTDSSLLPASEQNVVVDVSISSAGEVTDEKLVKGLGNPLDQLVLTTVKGWRFHPATLNGAAIASTEQLVFPFKRDGPGAGSNG